ncbi:hypothetical protein BLA29_012163, partial [Euroglyphus maynei]
SIYDSANNSRSQHDDNDEQGDICESNSTKTSSIDDDDDEEDSQTFSIENLPEDSTTSGSFMLDDLTLSNNTSEAINGSYLISDSISGSTSRNFYSVSNDLMNGEPLLNDNNDDNRMGKSEPVTTELLIPGKCSMDHVEQTHQSMPCNINSLPAIKQIGGENANFLRVRFEQRQRKAMERNINKQRTTAT